MICELGVLFNDYKLNQLFLRGQPTSQKKWRKTIIITYHLVTLLQWLNSFSDLAEFLSVCTAGG